MANAFRFMARFQGAGIGPLAQVVRNLLRNAAKLIVAGGWVTVKPRVEIGLRRAVARVADTGACMEKEMLSRLFHPFAQDESTLDLSKGGLDLGLVRVKGLNLSGTWGRASASTNFSSEAGTR